MNNKKFIFLLLAVVLIAGLLFYVEIRKAINITVTPNPTPLIADQTSNIPIDDSDPMMGNPGAPITIVEFGDIGCKDCQRVNFLIKDFVSKHPLDTRLVWKDAPRSNFFSDGYTLAHQAAQCAGKQNKFWQFLDIAMQNTNNLQEPGLRKIADGLNLNAQTWWDCTNSDATKQKITDSLNLADQLQITSLPAVFLNNRKILINPDIDVTKLLEQAIVKPDTTTQDTGSSQDTGATDLQTTVDTQTQ